MKNNYGRFKIIVLISLILLLFAVTLQASAGNTLYVKGLKAPQKEIKGAVTDQQGSPIAGVAVYIRGKSSGTVTNLDGQYSIRAVPGDTLVFSYLGFQPVEIVLEQQDQLNIQMEEDISSLGEVEINAGYYNTTRRESTGNISRVTAEEIELQPVVSPLQALQGRMAGVEITSGGVSPGAASTIRIRGTNSLRTEGNYPLYIIDGVPISSIPIESSSLLSQPGIDPLNNLDVNNIESIEVLKDADATAIYGSRGANGVVLITTRKGADMGTSLETRLYHGVATVPARLDLLNTEQYLDIRRRAFENDGVEPTENNAYDLVLWEQDRYTDWQEFLFGGTAETTNANVTFSGGSETTSFRLGGSYYNQGTVFPGDYNYRKVTGNINLNHQSRNNKFNLNLSANYGTDLNNLVGNVSFNANTIFLPPNAPAIFNEDGGLNWEDWGAAGLDNPLQGFFNNSTTQTNNLISNIGLSYEFLPGLQFKTSLGYTFYNSAELRNQPRRSYNPADATTNRSSHLSANRSSWIVEPQFIYKESIDKLHIQALIGATFQENSNLRESFQGSGYASEALIGNIGAAEDIINASRGNTEYRYAAVFSRLGFDWDKKYFINLTGRRDGSSRFGPNNRFANFGAVGAAWIFSDENFMQSTFPFLSFGKFRGSYGTTGNDQIGDYGYLDAYEATRGPGGLYPTGLANPDYSWEINKKLEGGIELGFFKDRFRFSLSRYQNRSSNQLVGYPLPYTTGFTSVQANLPATVENSGWEITFNSLNIDHDNFRWETSFNISLPKNELISYPDIEQSSYANTYRVGHPLNISLLYEYTGLDPETGFYAIRDVNEDGRYDYQDWVVIHDRNREFYGGLSNNLSYKNISLQFFLEFVKQEGSLTSFSAGTISNSMVEVLSSVDGQGPLQQISQSLASRTASRNALNTIFPIRDASYVRLKSLSLAYNLPRNLTETIGMRNAKVFLHGQNLITASSYDGLDPENPYSVAIGNLRTITGGLEINF
ncbi:SusC/RagA family TonB-linked outer membrane protein [Salinimicrobium marinum]|uniref:SusC/RagA family TonB-linked outer membrane protein n=1 Tax=Salinimicrobium marinum TaxID=680283 RepID=A0A918SAI3_9FLAO|nr:SusC/RagA family TonB-linked outer membrane protein [Salinimicrobium marinum]GHA32825.1 SusC/RagA family TonB-linked outer membrane protein [Salinimicrobium marinum]